MHRKPSHQDEKDSNSRGKALSLDTIIEWDVQQKVSLILTPWQVFMLACEIYIYIYIYTVYIPWIKISSKLSEIGESDVVFKVRFWGFVVLFFIMRLQRGMFFLFNGGQREIIDFIHLTVLQAINITPFQLIYFVDFESWEKESKGFKEGWQNLLFWAMIKKDKVLKGRHYFVLKLMLSAAGLALSQEHSNVACLLS